MKLPRPMRAAVCVCALVSPVAPCSAQDFLEPEVGSISELEPLLAYSLKIRKTLVHDADGHHLARVVCFPAFAPEWAVTVRLNSDGEVEIELDTAQKLIRSAPDPLAVKIVRSKTLLDRAYAEEIIAAWRRMLENIRYQGDPGLEADSVEYHMSSHQDGKSIRAGQCRTPVEGADGDTPSELLVTVGELLKEYVRLPKEKRQQCLDRMRAKIKRLNQILDAGESNGKTK